MEINLVRTSFACPQQYKAYMGQTQVGYLRLRHGYFRVDYPICGGQTIFEANTIGDGVFDRSEEANMLETAKQAIREKIRSDNQVTNYDGNLNHDYRDNLK